MIRRLSDLIVDEYPDKSNAEKIKMVYENVESYDDEFTDEIKKQRGEYETNKAFGDVKDKLDFNPLESEINLIHDFHDSPAGRLLDFVHKHSSVGYNLRLDSSTYQLPIVDFYTGIRLVFIDTDEASQMKIHVGFEKKNVPFKYKNFSKNYTTYFVYGDQIRFKKKATQSALIKIVGGLPEERRINLTELGYQTSYTTDTEFYGAFNKKYNVNPGQRTKSGTPGNILTVLAYIPKKYKRKKSITEMWQDQMFNSKAKMLEDNDILGVCSLKYIARKSPRYPNIIEYFVTEYIENPASEIADGLSLALASLYKEHQTKYPKLNIQIYVEYDSTTLPSPSMYKALCEKNKQNIYDFMILVTPNNVTNDYVHKLFGLPVNNYTFIKNPSIKQIEHDSDRHRIDMRIFQSVQTLSSIYGKEIRELGIQGSIQYDDGKKTLIQYLGLMECKQPNVITALVNPILMTKLQFLALSLNNMKLDNGLQNNKQNAQMNNMFNTWMNTDNNASPDLMQATMMGNNMFNYGQKF